MTSRHLRIKINTEPFRYMLNAHMQFIRTYVYIYALLMHIHVLCDTAPLIFVVKWPSPL